MRNRFIAAIMLITLVSTSVAVLAQSKVAVNSTAVIQGLKDMMSPSGKFATVEMADGTSFSTAPTTGIVAVANGGTGATTTSGARTNLGAAASGANADITSLTPGADFAINQNAVTPFTSVEAGAVENTLYLIGGDILSGTTTATYAFNQVVNKPANLTMGSMNTSSAGYEGFNFRNDLDVLVSSIAHSNSAALALPNSTWLGSRNAEPLHFVTGGTTPRISVDSTGRVSINNSTVFLDTLMLKAAGTLGILETYTDASNYSKLTIDATSAGYRFAATQVGTGIASRPFLFTNSLVQATGNESAYTIQGTVNKATSGVATILKVSQIDTASPTLGYLQEWLAGAAGTTQVAYVRDDGLVYSNSGIQTSAVYPKSSGTSVVLGGFPSSAAIFAITIPTGTVFTNTSGQCGAQSMRVVYNQTSGTSSNTDCLVDRTETAIGSGLQRLFSGQVSSSEKWGVDNKGKMYFDGVGDSTGTPGNATLNNVSGKSAIAASTSTCTITNSNVTTSSLVFVTALDTDATALYFKAVSAAGSFTVTTNAAATATFKFQWWVVN